MAKANAGSRSEVLQPKVAIDSRVKQAAFSLPAFVARVECIDCEDDEMAQAILDGRADGGIVHTAHFRGNRQSVELAESRSAYN